MNTPNAQYENRTFFGDAFYNRMLREYEEMRAFSNRVAAAKQRPDEETLVVLRLNKVFEASYKNLLFGQRRACPELVRVLIAKEKPST